ncbi:MAG: DUF1033 family protein [Streptococcaceae bacterium]|jgi:hypothetical protein|nr:DUF1033 family protein [Streptococcaceae bacterium]
MYRVIELFGDSEPWWFFEGWEEDIVSSVEFTTFDEARCYFENLWQKLTGSFPELERRDNFLAALWNENDERWCEECGDFLQQFHGLALLKDNHTI